MSAFTNLTASATRPPLFDEAKLRQLDARWRRWSISRIAVEASRRTVSRVESALALLESLLDRLFHRCHLVRLPLRPRPLIFRLNPAATLPASP